MQQSRPRQAELSEAFSRKPQNKLMDMNRGSKEKAFHFRSCFCSLSHSKRAIVWAVFKLSLSRSPPVDRLAISGVRSGSCRPTDEALGACNPAEGFRMHPFRIVERVTAEEDINFMTNVLFGKCFAWPFFHSGFEKGASKYTDEL
jgi:hypothetical protein